MAKIVFGVATSHSPQLSTPVDKQHLHAERDKGKKRTHFRGGYYSYEELVESSDDGILVIPHEREVEILAVAQMIEEEEEGIRAEVLKGMPLKEAREKFGYHQLQTKTN